MADHLIQGKGKLTARVRVFRAATGEWEDVPAVISETAPAADERPTESEEPDGRD